MLRKLELMYLTGIANKFFRAGLSEGEACRRIERDIGPISTLNAIRCAVHSVYHA